MTATQPRLSDRTVGVIGSGRDEHDDLAREVGTLLAALGVNLLTNVARVMVRTAITMIGFT